MSNTAQDLIKIIERLNETTCLIHLTAVGATTENIVYLCETLHQQSDLIPHAITNIVPAFNSIAVEWNPHLTNFLVVRHAIKRTENSIHTSSRATQPNTNIMRIPVCYDDEYALDMLSVATELKITKEHIIELHSQTIYTIQAVGFMPGFAFLGDTPEALQLPRKTVPLTLVPKNSVAIAQQRTAIYPFDSPGGWHVIGRTPKNLQLPDNILEYDTNTLEQTYPLICVGKKIQFQPISKRTFDAYTE